MKFRLAIVAVFAVSVISGCQRNTNEPIDFLIAPLKTGSDVKLSRDYKDKPVLVYVWATWCGPCKQFAPTLNKIADDYHSKGVAFLAISPESAKVVEESELKEPHRMTVFTDPYGSATEALQSSALPTIVVLDKEHRPIWGSRGTGTSTESDIRAALDSVM